MCEIFLGVLVYLGEANSGDPKIKMKSKYFLPSSDPPTPTAGGDHHPAGTVDTAQIMIEMGALCKPCEEL